LLSVVIFSKLQQNRITDEDDAVACTDFVFKAHKVKTVELTLYK